MPPKKQLDQVFLVVESMNLDDQVKVIEAHATHAAAAERARTLEENSFKETHGMEVLTMELKPALAATKAKGGKTAKAPKAKPGKAPLVEDDEDDDEDDEDEEDLDGPEVDVEQQTASKKRSKPDDPRKAVPEGKSNALEGLRLLFTGTFDIDRKTCEATAVKYGASIVKKLTDTDYVVLGAKPGPKKVDEIRENGLKTLSETEFYGMLKDPAQAKKKQKT